ncbi:MAG: hypothetical protein ACREMY_14035, partial [bacterium]
MLAIPSNLAPDAPTPPATGADGAPAPSTPPAPVNPDTVTKNFIPLFTDNSGTLGNSTLFQSGTGSSAKVGIGTTSPSTTLDVKGPATVRGNLALVPTGTANANTGKNSQPVSQAASVFNSITQTPVTQTFRWQAEPVGNNTPDATGSLNLLFATGTGQLTETGLNIASNGQITFAPGQTFPGAGTITGVTAGTDLTGGGNSGNVTLNLDTVATDTRYARLAAANNFVSNQGITGSLTVSDGITAASSNGTAIQGQGLTGVSGTGTNVGVYGVGNNGSGGGTGVIASGGNYGVQATGQLGVLGTGSIGLYGVTYDSTGVGVIGSTQSFSGSVGVEADNTLSSDGIALKAQSSGDPSSIAGLFFAYGPYGKIISGQAWDAQFNAHELFSVADNGRVVSNTLGANNAASFTKDSFASPGTVA